jgi:hypothetical protein
MEFTIIPNLRSHWEILGFLVNLEMFTPEPSWIKIYAATLAAAHT